MKTICSYVARLQVTGVTVDSDVKKTHAKKKLVEIGIGLERSATTLLAQFAQQRFVCIFSKICNTFAA
jgi:hypothetical protein